MNSPPGEFSRKEAIKSQTIQKFMTPSSVQAAAGKHGAAVPATPITRQRPVAANSDPYTLCLVI